MTFKPRLSTLRDLFPCLLAPVTHYRNRPLRRTATVLGMALLVSMPT
ncbi:MAG: hypothetical protein RI959_651, partial [Pseudomonadota bacterium]